MEPLIVSNRDWLLRETLRFMALTMEILSHWLSRMTFVRLLISMAAMKHWPLFQLDIKRVYMEQPPGFVAQGDSGLVRRLR